MANRVFYDDDARRRVLGGAKTLYDAVKTTMGPKGRNVVVGKSYGGPSVTHDGVTVAKAVDVLENDDETLGYKVGAELIKQAASKMNDVAGDGTTTVTVLTYTILNEANKLIAAGHNPMLLRKGLEAAAKDAVEKLDGMREDVAANKKRIAEVATISAGDAEIGQLIADVIEKVSRDGIVTVEEGKGIEMESEIVDGFNMDGGYVSPYMATDPARMEAVYEKPAVVITDKKISSIQEFLPLLEKIAQSGKKDLVLFAEDVDGDALTTLVLNRLKGVFNTVAVKVSDIGGDRKDRLEDIAILTGATVISEARGMTFEEADLNVVGTARKVIVGKSNTTIIEGAGTSVAVEQRIHEITLKAEATDNSYEKTKLQKRSSALSGKVAVIKVGGSSETEIEEKKYRVDDAVAAVKAALAEGIVPGGGVTLVNLEDAALGASKEADQSVLAGRQLLKNALEQPFRVLLTNAGLNADEWLPQVRAAKTGHGLDVNNPAKLVDLKASGIVDPARVTREALLSAVSIAGTSMTMGALVVDVPEPKDAGAAAGMGGLGGMM